MGNQAAKGSGAGPAKSGATGSGKVKSGGHSKLPKNDSSARLGEDLERLVSSIKANKSDAVLKDEFAVVWKKYDDDGNGYLDTEEGIRFVKDFMKVIASCSGVSYEKLVADLSHNDEDPSRPLTEGEVIRLFFAVVDVDDDGMITRSEFENYLKSNLPS